MNTCMVGTGYVGLVAGACLSDFGMNVICVDKEKDKIDRLKKGDVIHMIPISYFNIASFNFPGSNINFLPARYKVNPFNKVPHISNVEASNSNAPVCNSLSPSLKSI